MAATSTAEFVRAAVERLDAGQAAQAEHLARQALQANPKSLQAQSVLGLALSDLGRHVEAEQLLRTLSGLRPGDPVHWINLGTVLRAAGKLDEAFSAYQEAARLGERSPGFLLNVGLLHLDRGEYLQARSLFEQAVKTAPADAALRYYLALSCYECVRMEEAATALDGWRTAEGLTAELLANIGGLLLQFGESAQAEVALRMAREQAPGDAFVVLRQTQFLERTNRLEEARTLAAGLTPASVAKYEDEYRAMQGRLAERAGDYAAAKLAYQRLMVVETRRHQRHSALYLLAKVCDAQGQYEEAMDWLDQAHAAHLEFLKLTAPRFDIVGGRVLEIADAGCETEDVAQWQDENAPPGHQSPIFVVGFPRSGTTLLEQALDAHPRLRSMDETAFLQNAIDRIEALGVRYPQGLAALTAEQLDPVRTLYWQRVATKVKLEPGQRLVDKNPLNQLRLPAIRRLFPNARIILAVRHPCDVVLSCYMQHFRAPGFAILCRSLDSLAKGYRRTFDFWFEQAELLKPNVLELRYEDYVADFEKHMRAVAVFLELEWDPAMLDPGAHAQRRGFISTPSYSQVVQPVSQKAVGRWRRYEKYFQPVLGELRPYLDRWGYEA